MRYGCLQIRVVDAACKRIDVVIDRHKRLHAGLATAKAIADTYFKLIVPLVEKQRRFHKPLAANSRCVDRGTAVVDALAHKTVGQTQREVSVVMVVQQSRLTFILTCQQAVCLAILHVESKEQGVAS